MIGFAVVAFMAPTASQVLADVQKHYAAQTELTVDFAQTTTYATFGKTSVDTGVIYLQRPDKMHWDFNPDAKTTKKKHKEFIFDGKTLSMVEHINRRVYQSAVGSNVTLPAVVSFLGNGANLAKDFTVSLTTTSGYGDPGATVLELVPKAANAGVTKLYFVVDSKDQHVAQSIVLAPNGDINVYKFANPRTTKLAATTFVYDPKQYPGYTVEAVSVPTPAKP